MQTVASRSPIPASLDPAHSSSVAAAATAAWQRGSGQDAAAVTTGCGSGGHLRHERRRQVSGQARLAGPDALPKLVAAASPRKREAGVGAQAGREEQRGAHAEGAATSRPTRKERKARGPHRPAASAPAPAFPPKVAAVGRNDRQQDASKASVKAGQALQRGAGGREPSGRGAMSWGRRRHAPASPRRAALHMWPCEHFPTQAAVLELFS